LTAQESAVAQQQTTQSLSITEKNLDSARGKTLNAAQSDLVSKIRGFVKDAREACRLRIGAALAVWPRKRRCCRRTRRFIVKKFDVVIAGGGVIGDPSRWSSRDPV